MYNEMIDEFRMIDNEKDAREFAERCFERERSEPDNQVLRDERGEIPVIELFVNSLRYQFSLDVNDGGLPLNRVALWARVAASLQ